MHGLDETKAIIASALNEFQTIIHGDGRSADIGSAEWLNECVQAPGKTIHGKTRRDCKSALARGMLALLEGAPKVATYKGGLQIGPITTKTGSYATMFMLRVLESIFALMEEQKEIQAQSIFPDSTGMTHEKAREETRDMETKTHQMISKAMDQFIGGFLAGQPGPETKIKQVPGTYRIPQEVQDALPPSYVLDLLVRHMHNTGDTHVHVQTDSGMALVQMPDSYRSKLLDNPTPINIRVVTTDHNEKGGIGLVTVIGMSTEPFNDKDSDDGTLVWPPFNDQESENTDEG